MSTTKHLHFDQATEKDIPLILQFIHELAKYEKALDRVSATEDSLRTTLFGRKQYAEALIVRENDEAVAFAIYYFSYSSFSARPGLYLEDIFVRPSARKSGIGRQLIAFLAHKALELDCVRMEWSVLNWNAQAIRFYNSLSAEPVNDWTVFHLSENKMAELTNEVTA